MKTVLLVFLTCLRIGSLVYVLDVNYYYYYQYQIIGDISLLLACVNIIAIVFLFFQVRRFKLRNQNKLLFISCVIVAIIGVYIKIFTIGDPIIYYLRNSFNFTFIAAIFLSVINMVLLFDREIIKEFLELITKRDEHMERQVLDEGFIDQSEK